MKSTELKSYLQTLNSKVKSSMYKEVEITGTQIKVRGEKGNADVLYILNCGTKGNGIYQPEALSMLMLDIEADIEAFRIRDVEGWQVADTTTYDDLHVSKETMETLTEAVKYVSKDNFRPALCRVHFQNGDIMATDGYRGFAKKTGLMSLNGNLSASTLAVLKKLYKYGIWHIAFQTTPHSDNTQTLFNGCFTVIEKGVDTSTVPKFRELLEERDLDTDISVSFPYKALKLIADKNDKKVELEAEDDTLMKIYLEGKELPLRAKYQRVAKKFVKGKTIRLLMPRADGSKLVCLDLTLMNCFDTDKAGNVELRFKEASPSIIVL